MSAHSFESGNRAGFALPQLEQLRTRLAAGSHGPEMHAALAAEFDALELTIRERNSRWLALHAISTRLARELEEDRFLEGIVRHSVEVLHCNCGRLTLRDETTGDVVVQSVFANGAFLPELAGRRLGPAEGLSGLVLATGQPQLIPDYKYWIGRVAGFEELYGPSVLAVPVFIGPVVWGALIVTEGASPFSGEDVQTLVLFAQQAAAAVERGRYRHQAAALALSEERARVARELHDGLAQDLASLLLKVDRCISQVSEGDLTLRCELDDICVGLQRSIRDARSTILALRTGTADSANVEDGVRAQVAHFEERTGVPVQICLTGVDGRLASPRQCTALLDFVREGLRNIEKHAHAHNVQIDLALDETGGARIAIVDDGRGFDPGTLEQGAPESLHFGLRTQRDAVSALGGELLVHSARGSGARVEATFPSPDKRARGS